MKTSFFALAALALTAGLTACTQDELTDGNSLPAGEYPVIILANGLDVTVTRAAVDGDWQGVNSVALQIGDEVKEYTVTASDADGYRSATLSRTADPFYWTSRDPITVSAWWPCTDDDGNLLTTMPDVKVAENQSKLADFQNSDFISAENRTVVFDDPTLEFTHRTARVEVKLQPGTGFTSVAGATVSLVSLSGDNENPTAITACNTAGNTHEALAAPQTVAAGKHFIEVKLGNGTFSFRPQSDVVLEAGYRYTYTVSVNATGLTLEGSTIGDWGDGGGESGAAEDLGYNYDTTTNTCTVYTADGLLAWAEAAKSNLSLNCTLTADIDLTGKKWTPIGPDYDNPYTGTFDGGGHRITGLTINLPDQDYVGLFGFIGRGGTVKDVTLEGVQITTPNSRGYAGGVAGLCDNGSTLENCFVSGTVSSSYRAGGVVGYLYGSSLTRCGSSAAVEGTYYAGGVAGDIVGSGASLTACYSTGDVNGSYSVGGVVGYNSGTVTACYHATGSVSGQGKTGGVAGWNTSTLTACYWSDSPDTGIGKDDSGTGETTQVTDGDWTGAITRMNAALSGTDWEYIPGTDGLPVPGAAECMRALAEFLLNDNGCYACKIVTTDWHPYNHCSFVEYGGKWPAHCVQNSVGAAVFPPLLSALYSTPGRVAVLRKGTCKGREEYSIFKNRRSAMLIDRIVRGMMIERIDICGIAGDVCVLDTLRDGTALYGADLFRVLPRFSPSLDGGLLLNDALKSLPE